MNSFNKLLLIASLLVLAASGCAKYVDKRPLDSFSDDDFWSGEDNLRAYSWEFYSLFPGYGNGSGTGDFYFTSFNDDQADPSLQIFAANAPASNAAWNFYWVRKANLMLARIDGMPIPDEAKNHWKGVAKFFRAMTYFNLVKTFGGVPFINTYLDLADEQRIYKPRDSRVLVMDSVLADLNFAVANLRVRDQANAVNQDVAYALLSRVGLYEGTYRIYHKDPAVTNADVYLQACKTASEKLMNAAAGYTLNADYQTTYNSLDLNGNKQVILYKQYLAGFLGHSVIGFTNSSTVMKGMSKNAVEAYVCTDGLPISLSPLYKGDDTIINVRANRDKRLQETISDFLCYQGKLVNGLSSSTGYRPAKFLQPADNQLAPNNTTDAPIFGLPEVLLNYAEACTELDRMGKYSINQGDLDMSVNKLRSRAGVASLQLAGNQGTAINGVGFTDPKKDADQNITSLLWEVRRERRTELMLDGFRFDDLMRWAKGSYMDNSVNPDIFKGAKVAGNGQVKIDANGYITPYAAGTARPFIDPKNYLSAIPTGQIALYPDGSFKQNPGW